MVMKKSLKIWNENNAAIQEMAPSIKKATIDKKVVT